MGQTTFGGPKHFLDVEHNFVGPNFFGPLGVKIFTLKILLSPRFFKIFGSEKNFWSEKNLDKKNFGGQKIFLGPKKIWSKKILGLSKFFGEK